jgi:putative inorganic carbon (hco3(-)) transporter
MSLTTLLWLTLASLGRPIYASLAHLLVFFANPVFWWFGSGLLTSLTMRWSLVASLLLAVANFTTWKDRPQLTSPDRKFLWLLLLMALNGLAVNSLLADYPIESDKVFDILWKGCLSSGLLYLSIRSRRDLEILMFGLVLGCGFVGYQIVLSGAGSIEGGRLEGIRFAGAQGSNGAAAVLSLGLVLTGYFVISMRNRIQMIISLALAPLILESILRCNSRGSYLGLIGAGIAVLIFSKGPARKRAAALCLIGAVAILVLAGNQAIWNRFDSIFAESAERDNSASERLEYWEAAIKMIADYPLGSGGESAFASPRGVKYIAHFRPEFRSVHNGPLDIAAGWGIQGLVLLMSILILAVYNGWSTSKQYIREGEVYWAFLGSILVAALIGQLICCIFTSVLDGEWFLWLAAGCLAYTRTKQLEHVEDSQPNQELQIVSPSVTLAQ